MPGCVKVGVDKPIHVAGAKGTDVDVFKLTGGITALGRDEAGSQGLVPGNLVIWLQSKY
jgi:hypothetical protein